MDKLNEAICSWIDDHQTEFNDVADYIWQQAELSMEEHHSSAILMDKLEKYGFSVEKGVAGIPTAFIATCDNGGPVIGFNAEFDCLPGLSQEIGTKKKAIKEGGPGHGCGHNLLGAAAINAAIALKLLLGKEGLNATLKVFGTAAEELCIGKPFMAREGLFEGLDIFLDWHPWSYNRADYDTCNAYFNIKYHFKGKTAHGNSPWFGRSAFDAAMLQGQAVEMLREHIRPSKCGPDAANTINYTFSDVGPQIPNVVPDRTTAWYIGRFDRAELMVDVIKRVDKCAEAASMATETELEIEIVKQMQREMKVAETGLDETILPFGGGGTALCDTSEFSWHVPYATIWLTAGPADTGWHNWAVVSCAGSSIGKRAMNIAAKVIAATALDAIIDPEIIETAKAELKDRLSEREYIPLIPDEVTPPISINKENMDKYR